MNLEKIPSFQEKQAEAEFNSALAFLERLNDEEFQIEKCLVNSELFNAFLFLESYESELYFCFNEKEKEQITQMKLEINEYFKKYPGIGQVEKKGTRKFILFSNVVPELRYKLITLNRFMRGIKHKRGMGMPKKGEGKLF